MRCCCNYIGTNATLFLCSDFPANLFFSRYFTPQTGSKFLSNSGDPVFMELANVGQWLLKSKRRQKLLQQLSQPMTANQLHTRLQLSRRDCSDVISDMCRKDILICLNPDARRSRLYGLSDIGAYWRKSIFPDNEHYSLPTGIDWNLYGYVCYNHRKAVILALDKARKPSGIKLHLRFIAPDIRISANNVRNIISELLSQYNTPQKLGA